jgi:hypothetical protein
MHSWGFGTLVILVSKAQHWFTLMSDGLHIILLHQLKLIFFVRKYRILAENIGHFGF